MFLTNGSLSVGFIDYFQGKIYESTQGLLELKISKSDIGDWFHDSENMNDPL